MKKMIAALLAVAMLLSLAACGSAGAGTTTATAAPETQDNGTVQTTATQATADPNAHVENLVIGTIAQPDATSIYSQSGAIGKFQYNCVTNPTFFFPNENNEVQGYFAKSYEISEDGCELVMTFPTDKHWHDGEPVTADDVVFTMEYRRDVIKSPALKNLTEVRVDNEGQVTCVFSQPDAYYWVRSNPITQGVLPKHIWEKVDDPSNYAEPDAAIGCGPYSLTSVDTDAGIVVFDAYPGNGYLGEIKVDRITLKSYSSKDSELMALANKEIDLIYDYASPTSYTLLDVIAGKDFIDEGRSEYSGCNQATFGMLSAANQVYEFREAVVKCLDWDLIRQLSCGDYGQTPGSGVIPPVNVGYDDSLWKFYTDVDEANSILDKAGFADADGDGFRELPDGTPFTYKVSSQMTKAKQELFNRIGEIMVDGLKKIGVNAYYDTDALTSSEANKAMVTEGAYDLFIGYTTSGVASYRTAIWYFLNRAVAGSGGYNWGDTLDDPALNKAYEALQDANSDEEYVAAVKELQKIVSENLYGFALTWEDCFFPYRTDEFDNLLYYPAIGVVTPVLFYNIAVK